MIPDTTVTEIKSRLAARVEEVARHLLPGGKRKGREWKAGGVDGGPGNSLGVELDGERAGAWHDRAEGQGGGLVDLWMAARGLQFPEAVREAAAFVGLSVEDDPSSHPISLRSFTYAPPAITISGSLADEPPAWRPTPGFDWEASVAALTPEKAAEIAAWRGYSVEFVEWLHREKLIGLHRGNVAFPVHGKDGVVTRCHYRTETGWSYHPTGGDNAALVIGVPAEAGYTIAAESQWDAFALLDALGHHEDPSEFAAVITRGANSNTDFSKIPAPLLLAVPQNDPDDKRSKKNGRTPAEEWLEKVRASKHKDSRFLIGSVPPAYKDANDWLRADKPAAREIRETLSASNQ